MVTTTHHWVAGSGAGSTDANEDAAEPPVPVPLYLTLATGYGVSQVVEALPMGNAEDATAMASEAANGAGMHANHPCPLSAHPQPHLVTFIPVPERLFDGPPSPIPQPLPHPKFEMSLLHYVQHHTCSRLPIFKAVRLLRQMVRAVQSVMHVSRTGHKYVCLDNFAVRLVDGVCPKLLLLCHPLLHPGVADTHPDLIMLEEPCCNFHNGWQPQYKSPEAKEAQSLAPGDMKLQEASDVYALGCCLFAMLFGRWLFRNEEEREKVHQGNLNDVLYRLECNVQADPRFHALQLIQHMTCPNPHARATFDEVLDHEWCVTFGRMDSM